MHTTDLQSISIREKNIPGFYTLFDLNSMVDTIGAFFPKKNLKHITLSYIRYKPGINCLTKYTFTVNGQTYEFYAKAFGRDKEVKIKKSKERKTTQNLGFGRIFIENKGILINSFPNDNKIKFLNYLDSGKNQKDLFTQLFPDRKDLWNCELETLNYKPERRFVGAIKTKSGPQAVIKLYEGTGYTKAKKNANLFKSQKNFKTSRLLSWDNKKHVLCFEWIPGKEFSKIFNQDTKILKNTIIETAHALAELHSEKKLHFGNLRPYNELLKFKELEILFNQICPHLKKLFQNIERQIESFLSSSLSITTPIHGDFNTDQVIVDKLGNIALIDFDRAVLGDPRLDLGSFIASLHYQLISKEISNSQFQMLQNLFLTSYFSKIKKKYDDIDMFVAASLFKLAHQPYRTNHKNWLVQIEQILNSIEKLIKQNNFRDSKQKITTNRQRLDIVSKLYGKSLLDSNDTKLPYLTTCLNSSLMEPYFYQLFEKKSSGLKTINLKSIKKIRHKPGNRCLLEYKIQLSDKDANKQEKILLGKMHSKGLDKTTFRIQKSLEKSGFDTKSLDKISIPKTVGKIPECEIWLQEKVDGIPLIELLLQENGKKIARKVAEAIHKVHSANISTKKNHTTEKELQILEERLIEVAKAKPTLSDRIKKVIEQSFELAQYLSPADSVGIHRDFYHDQVLVKKNRLFLLDFDLYCMGDPALDIGNFVAHLQELSLRKFGKAKALSGVEKALVNRFLELSGDSRRTSIEIYTTLTLARHISISQQFEDRRQFTESLIKLCEKRLKKQLSELKSQNHEKIKAYQRILT